MRRKGQSSNWEGLSSSSISDDDGSENALHGMFSSLIDHVFKAVPVAVEIYIKQKLEDMRNRKEEKRGRRIDSSFSASHARYSKSPYRNRGASFNDQELPYQQSRPTAENLVDRGIEKEVRFASLRREDQRGLQGKTKRHRQNDSETIHHHRRYSEAFLDRHHLRRSISQRNMGFNRRSRSSSPRKHSRNDHTTVKITLPFSDHIMHAGAVGIIAGATTAIRLRASDTEWLGDKGVRAGSSAALAAMASLLVGSSVGETDIIREAALPVVFGLGVDHMLWE